MTKKNSRFISLFVAIIFLLSTVNITVFAADTMIWEEDLSVTPNFYATYGWGDCWVTYNAQGTNGSDLEKNYYEIKDQKIVFRKSQDGARYGSLLVTNNILNPNVPTTGNVIFEMDYTLDGLYEKSGCKALTIFNENSEEMFALSFGSKTPGIFDSTALSGDYTTWSDHYGEYVSGDAYEAMADGQTIHIKVIFDLDLGKYEAIVTHNGNVYRDRNGAQNLPSTLTTKQIGKIRFYGSCDSAPTAELKEKTITSTYDNMKLYVPEVVVPEVLESSITDGENNVAVDTIPQLTFSTPMTMATLNGVTLVKKSNNEAVALTPSLSADATVATFAHEKLLYDTEYVLTVPTTTKSVSGGTLGTAKTYTFTTPSASILWSEDFSVLPSMSDPSSYVPGSAIIGGIWDYGWGNNWVTGNDTGTDGRDNSKNYYGINNKLIFVKGQNRSLYGNLLVENNILNSDIPTTGTVVFEFDYTIDSLYDEAYSPVVQIKNEAGEEMFALNFGHKSVGIFDSTGVNFSQHYSDDPAQFGEFVSGDDYEAMADGQPIHIKVVFDLDLAKYYATVTHNGVTYRDRNGVQNIPTLSTKQIGKVRFWGECSTGTSTESVTSTYDNIKLYVPTPVVPEVSSTTIADGAVDVNVTEVPSVTFSTPMNISSLAGIKLYKGSISGTEEVVTPEISADGTTISFTHAEKLAVGTTYYLSIPATVKSEGNENISSAIIYDFTTVAVEPIVPTIVSKYITDGDTGIGLNDMIKVLWNTQMDFETLSGVKMYKGSVGGTAVPLTPSISTDGFATYFNHDPLEYSTTYVMVIPTTVKSATNGVFATEEVISFTTIDRTAQHRNVLWFEDFDARKSWTSMEANLGWGYYTWNEGVAYSTMGDNDNLNKNKAEWRYGGVLFTKIQNFKASEPVLDSNGNPTYDESGKPITTSLGNNINLRIPLSGFTMPTEGLVALEYDFTQSDVWLYKYTPDIYVINTAGQQINLLGLNSGNYGFQDLTGGRDVNKFHKNIAPKEAVTGKKVHVQIMYDLDRSKYTIYYTVDGVRTMATEGEQDMLAGINYDVARLAIACQCGSKEGAPIELLYDNFAMVQYDYPEVSYTSAPQGATDVAVDDPIVITFTEPMKESTLENITLKQGTNPVTITGRQLSEDKKTVTLNHNGLTNNTGYKLVIPTSVLSDDYIAPQTEITYEFTTVLASANPVVKSVSVQNGQIDVSRTAPLSVTFSKQMNLASLSNITLSGGGNNIPLSVSLIDNNKTASLTHGELEYGTEYTLTIPTTVKAADNTAVTSQVVYKFTTVYSPTKPVIISSSVTNGDTGVPAIGAFVITFDKAMNTSSFSNIKLMQGDTPVTLSAFPSNGDKTVTLSHTKLAYNTQYTLTIPTTVKSTIGLGLASDIVYTFTTAPAVEGETLLYGYYFDRAPDGSNEVKAQYKGEGWNAYTVVSASIGYRDDQKIEFKDGKMVITKSQNFEKGTPQNNRATAYVDLPTTNLPTTGVMAIEYDIKYSDIFTTAWYADTLIKTDNNVTVTSSLVSSTYYGWMDLTLDGNINTQMKNISNASLVRGKDVHMKLVYNLDDWTYAMYYTIDGITTQSKLGVRPLPASTSKKISHIEWTFSPHSTGSDPVIITIDNLEVKKLTKPQVTENTSITNGQTGVSTTDKIKIAFNESMNPEFFKDIKIYEGTVDPANIVSTTPVVGEDSTICYIYPDHGLKYNTKYIANIPATVTSESLIPVTSTDIEFTTERATVGYSVAFNSVKNFGGVDIYDIAGLNFVKASVKFTNNFGTLAKNPVLAVALCNSEGKIKSISYCELLLLFGQSQDVTISFTSEKPFESGDHLKAYVMDRNSGDYMSAQVSY